MSLPIAKGSLEPSTCYQVTQLASYSEGAIVSRTLKKSAGGTLTAFAFDEGQELSEHTAPFDAFVQVVDGEVELSVGGTAVRAVAGDLVLMPAHVPHAVKAASRCMFLLILIRDPA